MPPARASNHAASVVSGLDRLYQVNRLYGDSSHAGVQRALDTLIALLRAAFDSGLVVHVTPDGFVGEGLEAPDRSEFWKACREAQIASITIRPGASASDLSALVRDVGAPDAADRITGATGDRIAVASVDLSSLATAEPGTDGFDWRRIIRSLADQGWSEDDAELLNRAGASLHGEDDPMPELATAIGDRVRAAARSLRSASETERARKLAQLRTFLSTLDPALRRALIAKDSETFAGAADTLGELAEVLPVKEVLGALRQTSLASAQPSTAALRMFQQLARNCAGDGDASAELHRLSELWRRSVFANDTGADAVLISIGDLLQSVNSETYCPETYLAELDRIGGVIESGGPPRHLPSAEETTLGVAEISAEILKNSPDGLGAARMLLAATGSIASAIETGRHDTARNLVRAAARAHGDAAPAARSAIEAITSDPERLVRSARRSDDQDATLELLRLCADSALRPALLELGARRDGPDTALWSFVHGAKLDPLVAALESLVAEGHPLPPPRRLCEPLGFNIAMSVLWPMFDAKNSSMRRAAFAVVASYQRRWPLRILTRALGDADPGIQINALECLGEPTSELECRLLAGMIEGRGAKLSDGAFELAARALMTARDPAGAQCLHTAFLKLLSTGEPAQRQRTARLASIIRTGRAHPLMRDAWRRWRLSPCRLRLFLDRRGARP